MKNSLVRVFLGGDIFGQVGMRCVARLLPDLVAREGIDFAVINGENASAGIGLSADDARAVLAAGADAITGGNHTFEKRDYWPVLSEFGRVLRPANYPPNDGIPGRGAAVFEKAGRRFAVLNLQGREDMTALDCPFRCADAQVAAWKAEYPDAFIIVDFHAESNEEKEALGLYLDGRVVSVSGTHTHVQTADERVLAGGTAYMTDIGMTGAFRSVIGADPALAVKRNITQVLYRMDAPDLPGALRGLIVDIDPATGKAAGVTRIEIPE